MTTVTNTARISVAGSWPPTTRTAHSINVRARKTNAGHTAAIGIHLYEGAVQRTTSELTQSLTSSLATYSLAISDADAATISSYADLEIRIRGFSTTDDLATFEVAELSLSIPNSSPALVPTEIMSFISRGAG